MKLYIVVLICNISNQVCDTNTARAFQAFAAPEGIIVCPASVPVMQSAVAPSDGEYIKVRCQMGR